MPQRDKSACTDKQMGKAEHIKDSGQDRGKSASEAERIAWATVNRRDGGGNRSGAGRDASR